ncbi:hypothetical protein V6N13_061999 [Hibiscus sabdariffa]|uniref:F-box domain-containing protein n=1 Tax=Hibiscus sabdariffa TaxID=183260 RepID=A0ABR2PF36_9ROSI
MGLARIKKYEEEPGSKRLCVVKEDEEEGVSSWHTNPNPGQVKKKKSIKSGSFSKIPPDLFTQILKHLSPDDLVSCSLVCSSLSFAASDESLWRRLYRMRWGLLPPMKMRECTWKKLYIQRDEEDLIKLVRNCPSELKDYYIQMQAAKRSQAPLPCQANEDESIILDKTMADRVTMWRSSRGLADEADIDHACSGETCSYYQIGCEKTGKVHVCDDTCREVILDPNSELLVCTISGHCFDRLLSPSEMEQQQAEGEGGGTDDVSESEPFLGSARFARAYLLGYNCEDEKELDALL